MGADDERRVPVPTQRIFIAADFRTDAVTFAGAVGQEVADASPCLVNGMIYTASLQRQFFMRRQAVLFPADVAIIFHGRFVQFQMAIAGG